MDKAEVTNENGETNWMILSPWWLAKYHYDTAQRHLGYPPPLEGLGQMLLDTHKLGIPPNILGKWMEQFKYIS